MQRKKNREGKEVIDAIVTALNADYTQFIETMRTKGIKTAIDEAKAQEHLQKELSETGSKYQEAGSSVAGFATKALGAVGIVMSIGTIFCRICFLVLKKIENAGQSWGKTKSAFATADV